MIDIPQTIIKLYPQVTHIVGFDNPIAYDAEGNQVQYDKTAVQAYIDSHAYIAKRQAEYPPFTDYLDGIAKGDQAQINKYIADCLAVKQRNPK